MIYISGRITGNKKWKEEFNAAERYLLLTTHEAIVNPENVGKSICAFIKNPKWEDYMEHCIGHLLSCDKIYMLRGWWKSKGARLERKIAKTLGMKVIYQRKKECGK